MKAPITLQTAELTILLASLATTLAAFGPAPSALAADPAGNDLRIEVRADQVLHPVSRYLTGACIEDVNHEIYGGIYSQMVFGESFQEPPIAAVNGFRAYGGDWQTRGEELLFSGAAGDKLVSGSPPFTDGEAGVEVFVPDKTCSNAGLIVRVSRAGPGVDEFDGYEIALNAAAQNLRLGRHRHNWELIRDQPCPVPQGQWVALVVKLTGPAIEVFVNGKTVLRHDDGTAALGAGAVGLRQFQPSARYRNLWVKSGGETRMLRFDSGPEPADHLSRVWGPVRTGDAVGALAVEGDRPFVGRQAQQLTFVRGAGQIGVENQGLNRWGLCFRQGKTYEGLLWARADAPADLFVALENQDGSQALAEKRLAVKPGDWQPLTFTLKPNHAANPGRLAITLRKPGSVLLGYASLQPGDWGRFKHLPVRRDVAQGLIDQGITVLRYGGSMVNHPEYRWKNMIGPRDRRPPYHGTWYPYSSNGWGIPDFMSFCEAAGFEYVPAFNMGETPQDMADFIKYAKQPASGEWGRRRAADGHPAPYRLKFLELGNEETVDDHYWEKFRPMAEAIWAVDPAVVPVVGDFFYNRVIRDPYDFAGGAVHTLAAHKKILDLARQHGCEVRFDIHIGTEQPPQPGPLAGERSFIDQLAQLSPGAKFSVVIFEFNAGNHHLKRALSNALAINRVERDGRIPIAASANGLQPDGQNDNGWDQGLLFLNPAQVWLQPPGFVTQMFSRNYQPLLVSCQATVPPDTLDINAKRSQDGRTLVLQAVNPTASALDTQIHVTGFAPAKPAAQITELSGPLDAVNTAAQTNAILPRSLAWPHHFTHGDTRYTFPPHSVTTLRFE